MQITECLIDWIKRICILASSVDLDASLWQITLTDLKKQWENGLFGSGEGRAKNLMIILKIFLYKYDISHSSTQILINNNDDQSTIIPYEQCCLPSTMGVEFWP